MVKIIISGAAGRMGKTVLRLALEDKDIKVTGLLEAKGHPYVGKDGKILTEKEGFSLTIGDDLSNMISGADVVIDFSSPDATLQNFRIARENKVGIVIGTTGIPQNVLDEIYSSKDARVVLSPNMSVGVNLLFELVELSASILKGYDIEILELHHRWKKDAPSGTALRIKDIIENKRKDVRWSEVYGRKGVTGERRENEIGIMSLRGGDVVGEHTVIFAGEGERFEIIHRASSRDTFAKGAILAAKWLVNRSYGIYSMKDVLFSDSTA